LVQLPIFIAVYQVLRDGLTKPESLDLLYGFVSRPEMIDPHFFSLLDLSQPNAILAVAAGLAQFWQGKMLFAKRPAPELREKKGAKDEDTMALMNKQMMYLMPIMITFIGFSLPSGLSLYWLVSTLFMIAQQYIAFKHKTDTGVTKVDEKIEVIAKQ
jgi:YidC/Oxa1 family membrane protein insertase